VAQEMLQQGGAAPVSTPWDAWYYGSVLRDRGILLLLRQRLGQAQEAWKLGAEIARDLSGDRLYDTHATSWSLMALAQTFGDAATQESRFALRDPTSGKWNPVTAKRVIYRHPLQNYQAGRYAIRNDDGVPLYVSLTQQGVPPNGEEEARNNGLELSVRYTSTDGKPLAVHALKQGEDFIAEVTVKNPGDRTLENLALTQVVPSGWQIRNPRLEGAEQTGEIDYQDIRDDRVSSYFALLDARRRQWPYWWGDATTRARKDTLTLKLMLNASFAGRYYLPGWRVDAMYDPETQASSSGQWVEVAPR
jgi:uncharacterized protein YfaS (alpha-2-macroglobulin family)